jgi:hypothetical protein
MINLILLYSGSFFLFFWGVAHLIATRSVVDGFSNISLDNKRIITMEWIIEGLALIFIAVVVAVVSYIDYTSVVSRTIYWLSFVMLNTLSTVSLFTGFKVNVLPFKLCPIIFTAASVLIVVGSYV